MGFQVTGFHFVWKNKNSSDSMPFQTAHKWNHKRTGPWLSQLPQQPHKSFKSSTFAAFQLTREFKCNHLAALNCLNRGSLCSLSVRVQNRSTWKSLFFKFIQETPYYLNCPVFKNIILTQTSYICKQIPEKHKILDTCWAHHQCNSEPHNISIEISLFCGEKVLL